MVNGLSPPYISPLLPLPVDRVSSYNLHNSNDIQTIPARTYLYYNSFLQSAIQEWNNLPLDVRTSESLYNFKRRLNDRYRVVPKYHYSGNRKLQILHTRLRTGCSSLNHDLFTKHITDTPLCRCGEIENADQYFLSFLLYQNQRVDLINIISRYTQVTLQVFLYGSNTLPLNANNTIFEAVRKYIERKEKILMLQRNSYYVPSPINPLRPTYGFYFIILSAFLFFSIFSYILSFLNLLMFYICYFIIILLLIVPRIAFCYCLKPMI